jgi:hypothetical protein
MSDNPTRIKELFTGSTTKDGLHGDKVKQTENKAIGDTAPALAHVEPWTDAELDAMTDDYDEGDLKDALSKRTPAMRDLLRAKPDNA